MFKAIAIAIILIGLALVGGLFFVNQDDKKEEVNSNVYQGPVKPSDDLEYFRQTGITKPLEKSN